MIFYSACEDDTSRIGPGLTMGEVSINVDSLVVDLHAKALKTESFDSRTGNLLLGNIETEEYGSLFCSFVTRLMCVPNLNVPDSLLLPERVDSCKIFLELTRGNLTGDSLAPQKLSVFLLNRQLPSDIDNNFDPTGYYDQSNPLGQKSYTLSNIAYGDSIFLKRDYVQIGMKTPLAFGQEIFRKYKEEPELFQWPSTFAQYIPGYYVEQTFGKGCVGNIATLYTVVYYHSKGVVTETEGEETVTRPVNVADSVIPFMVSPEVLSSNNVKYKVAEQVERMNNNGEIILTTPGGYRASFTFPAEEIIAKYEEKDKHLSTVNDLLLTIPAEPVDNRMGIPVAPNLLLIKSSEVENFFSKNKIPDNKTSFTAIYDSVNKVYLFSSMREYMLNLLAKKDSLSEDDLDFTIIPVEISTETNSSYYGTGSTYVTKCVPYTVKPTLTRLHTEEASIIFSFSSQYIE